MRADERRGRGPDWYLNLCHEPRCQVEIDGHTLDGRFVPTEDRDAALRRLVTMWREKYGALWVSDWYIDAGRRPVRVVVER